MTSSHLTFSELTSSCNPLQSRPRSPRQLRMGSRAEQRCDTSFLSSLPCEIIAHIASFLPLGEPAYGLRITCKALARELRFQELLTVPIGAKSKQLPVPEHALLARWGKPGCARGLTYKQRVKLLSEAARGGHTAALAQLSHSTGCLVNEEVFRAAARAGQEEVCDWLLQQECPLGEEGGWVLAAAAEGGHTALCRELGAAGLRTLSYAGKLAALGGHAEVLDWLGLQQMQEPEGSDWPAELEGTAGELPGPW